MLFRAAKPRIPEDPEPGEKATGFFGLQAPPRKGLQGPSGGIPVGPVGDTCRRLNSNPEEVMARTPFIRKEKAGPARHLIARELAARRKSCRLFRAAKPRSTERPAASESSWHSCGRRNSTGGPWHNLSLMQAYGMYCNHLPGPAGTSVSRTSSRVAGDSGTRRRQRKHFAGKSQKVRFGNGEIWTMCRNIAHLPGPARRSVSRTSGRVADARVTRRRQPGPICATFCKMRVRGEKLAFSGCQAPGPRGPGARRKACLFGLQAPPCKACQGRPAELQ